MTRTRGVAARQHWWSLTVVVLVALNLRPAVVAVSPVLGRIRDEYGLSATAAGLLTTIPVLCFGALAPAAAALARRRGLDLTTVAAVAGLVTGSFVRLAPSTAAVFAGTVLLGGGIAIGNVVVPAVVKRDFPARPGSVMGLYSAALSGGAAAAAGLTVPLADATGGWRAALAYWAFAALAVLPLVVAWAAPGRHAAVRPGPSVAHAPVRLLRDALAWQLTAFMGLQSFGFYATTAWIPQILVDRGTDETRAGWLLSVAAIAGLVASLLVPVRATRTPSQVGWGLAASTCCAAGLLGLLLGAPPLVSVIVLGLGQGGCLALALTWFALRAPDAWVTTRLSGMAQTVGYLVAALGPVVVGSLHDVTGAWTSPLLLLVVLALAQAVLGGLAGRHRIVGGTPPERATTLPG